MFDTKDEFLAGFGKVAAEIEAGRAFGESSRELSSRLNALALRHVRNARVKPLRASTALDREAFARGFGAGIEASLGF